MHTLQKLVHTTCSSHLIEFQSLLGFVRGTVDQLMTPQGVRTNGRDEMISKKEVEGLSLLRLLHTERVDEVVQEDAST